MLTTCPNKSWFRTVYRQKSGTQSEHKKNAAPKQLALGGALLLDRLPGDFPDAFMVSDNPES